MIEITLNGEAYQLNQTMTVADLIAKLGMTEKRVAVEYNLEILPKSLHAETQIQAQDRVEIVHAIGGG